MTMSIVTTQLREYVNQKLRDNNRISHNDVEEVLIQFYESHGLIGDELHEAVTELWADFNQRGRTTP